jgi:hypothetical protein
MMPLARALGSRLPIHPHPLLFTLHPLVAAYRNFLCRREAIVPDQPAQCRVYCARPTVTEFALVRLRRDAEHNTWKRHTHCFGHGLSSPAVCGADSGVTLRLLPTS